MKRIIINVFACLVLVMLGLIVLGRISIGADLEKAPDVKLEDINGKSFELTDYRGKVVLVNFWAVWCQPCKVEIPSLVDLYRRYDTQLVVIGIAIDSGTEEKVQEAAKQLGIPYPVVNGDYDVRTMFGGIRAVPTTFLINQEGKIYKTYLGYREKQVIEEDIQTLLGPPKAALEKQKS